MWNFTSPITFLLASGYRASGDVERNPDLIKISDKNKLQLSV